MNTIYQRALALYLSGQVVPPALESELRQMAQSPKNLAAREKARVLVLCVEGQSNYDAHTRALATKRTLNALKAAIIRPAA